MSRIGSKPIEIPSNVSINIFKNSIKVEGPLGSQQQHFLSQVFFEQKNTELLINRSNDSKFSKSYQGLCRTLIVNMINGVLQFFSKILVLEGIGYKFQLTEKFLILYIGYTHPIKFSLDPTLKISLESPTKLLIQGINKEKVGLFAANIRKIRPPEPYKGKGIFYINEKIKRKTGKK